MSDGFEGPRDLHWEDESSKALNEQGNKARQRDDDDEDQDRAKVYRDWHYKLPKYKGKSMSACDIDQVEYGYINGVLTPFALIELTRTDDPLGDNPNGYLANILKRFMARDSQWKIPVMAAEGLGCKAWLVLFQKNLEHYWVFNLTDGGHWFGLSEPKYEDWLHSLRDNHPGAI